MGKARKDWTRDELGTRAVPYIFIFLSGQVHEGFVPYMHKSPTCQRRKVGGSGEFWGVFQCPFVNHKVDKIQHVTF